MVVTKLVMTVIGAMTTVNREQCSEKLILIQKPIEYAHAGIFETGGKTNVIVEEAYFGR